jgi:Protein of unknown function (DUF2934)
MAEKTSGNTRKSTSSRKATQKKGAAVTPIDQSSTVTPIDQNLAQNPSTGQNQSSGGNQISHQTQSSAQNGSGTGNQSTSRAMEASNRTLGPELVERIRARAYELFEQRGRQEGFDQEDWARAEAEIMERFEREKSA